MGGPDKGRNAYKVICWKSATIVLAGKRVVSLKKDTLTTDGPEKMLLWHGGWPIYNAEQQDIIGEVEVQMATL